MPVDIIPTMTTGLRLRVAAVVVAIVSVAACNPKPLPAWTPAPGPTGAPEAPGTSSPASSASAAPSVAPSTEPSTPPSGTPIAGGWTFVKSEPCPDSDFECITLSVPRDHFVAGGPTWDVTFGILRASGTKKGTFVTAMGGPGLGGLAYADDYTSYFPEGVSDAYDIVFFDQRGIGLSQPFQCPNATGEWYAIDADATDPADAAAFKAGAEAYVTACIAETGVDASQLPYYATRQAVEDLEAFREYLGAEELDLYGESYGTQYAQAYAASHPDRVATLYLDGPVDMTLDGASYYAETARAFDDVLIATMTACDRDPACAADYEGSSPLDAYDALAAAGERPDLVRLRQGRRQHGAPNLHRGGPRHGCGVLPLRPVRPDDARAGAGSRRSMATSRHSPGRPRSASRSIRRRSPSCPTRPTPTRCTSRSSARTTSTSPSAGAPSAQADAYFDVRPCTGLDPLRLDAMFYEDMPCVFWPNRPTADPRPAPIVDAPYRTFILVGTGDPRRAPRVQTTLCRSRQARRGSPARPRSCPE